ncbi:MAG: sulfatase-like hydrolase/transferase [Bacteroidales bacterium]
MVKYLSIYISGLVSSLGTSSYCLYAQEKRPNILLIMTDQQSHDMISHYNRNGLFSTPNLDRIFSRGVSFSNCYVSNPVSVPSRFALMTGVSPAQYGIRDNLGKYSEPDENGIRKVQEKSMGALFSNNGYETYYGGKVHLPYAHGKNNMFASAVNYGFQHYLTRDDRQGLSEVAVDIIKGRNKQDKPMLMVLSYLNPHDICAEVGNELSAIENERDSLTAATIKEMRRLADATSPELYPNLPPNLEKTKGFDIRQKMPYQDFTDSYWRRYRFIYYRLAELVDKQIGSVLDAIEQSAIAGNTIIVFTSDHGEMGGAHRLRTKNAPYSECQKVPLVFAGKSIDKAFVDSGAVCNGSDLLPTLCTVGEITIPENLVGESLAKRIRKKEEMTDKKRNLFLEGAQFYQIVSGNNFKYTRFTTSPFSEMLIDLRNDPYETNNVIADYNYQAIREELRNDMNEELAKRELVTTIIPLPEEKKILSVIRDGKQIHIKGYNANEILIISDLAGIIYYNDIPKAESLSFSFKEKGFYLISTRHSVSKIIY